LAAGAITSPSVSIDIRSTTSTPVTLATVPQFRASLQDLMSVAPELPESELQQDRLRFFFPARDDEYGRSGSE
jgi:hypothetical protein